MADFSVTATAFVPSTSAQKRIVTFGATITRGKSLYYDTASGKYKLYQANGAGDIKVFAGLAGSDGADNQLGILVEHDPDLTPGFTLANGATVIGSGAAAGGLAPVADNTTGWFNQIVGVGKGSNKMNFFGNKYISTAAGVAT